MTDDIVTGLRMSADLINGFPKASAKSLFPTGWLSEAADEIERLRNELAVSKQECQMADDAVQDLQARLLDALRQLKGTQK